MSDLFLADKKERENFGGRKDSHDPGLVHVRRGSNRSRGGVGAPAAFVQLHGRELPQSQALEAPNQYDRQNRRIVALIWVLQ